MSDDAQEAKWAADIERTQREFEDRVHTAAAIRTQAGRKKHYTQLRKEMGDDGAREVAKMVEGIFKGTAHYPKWFKRLP
jgi:hypothetical protein